MRIQLEANELYLTVLQALLSRGDTIVNAMDDAGVCVRVADERGLLKPFRTKVREEN